MNSLRTASNLLLAVAVLVAPALAQPCPGATDTFWKRDILPIIPSGFTAVSIIQGLCEGESGGVVFNMPAGMPAQKLTQVVAPWGSAGGVNGQSALLDLEVYDGISFSGAIVNMGTMVFSLTGSASASMQVASHGLNTLDVSAFNIVVGNAAPTGNPPTRKFAVCFRVDLNNYVGGSCATGWPANLFTDNGGNPFGGCNGTITPQQTSLMEIQGQGWRDAALATVSGFQLCPFYYSGIWCIRCCTTNAAPPNPFQINSLTTLPVTAPNTVILQFLAPGQNLYPYVAAASLATSPGIPTPYGTVPLAPDGLFNFSISPAAASIFINYQGIIGASGTATALINVPYLGGQPFAFYTAFIVIPPSGPWPISDAKLITVN